MPYNGIQQLLSICLCLEQMMYTLAVLALCQAALSRSSVGLRSLVAPAVGLRSLVAPAVGLSSLDSDGNHP